MNDSMIRELSIDGVFHGETWEGRGTQWGSGSRFGYPVAPGFLAPWHIDGDGWHVEGDIPIVEFGGCDGIKFGGGSDGGGQFGIWPNGGGGQNDPTETIEGDGMGGMGGGDLGTHINFGGSWSGGGKIDWSRGVKPGTISDWPPTVGDTFIP